MNFTTPGATAELRTGTSDFPGTKDGDAQLAASFTILRAPGQNVGSSVVLNGDGKPVRYLLIWITKLPPSDVASQYQVGVEDIQIMVN